MSSLKQKVLETHNISDQNALVQKLLKTGPRIIKRVIPAGKTMFEQIDKPGMQSAVYNWLRGCGGFTEVTISFAKEPERWVQVPTKALSFDTRDPKPVWERTPTGRKELAKQLANFINDPARRIVYLTVRPDGIYIGEDKKQAFKPYVVLTEADLAKHPTRNVGDKVASEDWEPYVEFNASNRSKYTSYATPESIS